MTASRDEDQAATAVAGLRRTSICRVAAAALYVVVGVDVLVVHVAEKTVTFGVFVVVQLLWQANARADVRLHRRLTTNPTTGAAAADSATSRRGRHSETMRYNRLPRRTK